MIETSEQEFRKWKSKQDKVVITKEYVFNHAFDNFSEKLNEQLEKTNKERKRICENCGSITFYEQSCYKCVYEANGVYEI